MIVLLLLGTFYAATDGVLAALVSRLVSAEARGSGIAAAQTVVALTRFVSAVGFGRRCGSSVIWAGRALVLRGAGRAAPWRSRCLAAARARAPERG